MRSIDRGRAVKAALLMVVVLAPVFVILAITLSKSFFEDWGWLAGPGAWLLCALIVGRIMRLPLDRVAAAAVLSGLPSGLLVLIGLHDVGPVVSIPLFGALVGHIPHPE